MKRLILAVSLVCCLGLSSLPAQESSPEKEKTRSEKDNVSQQASKLEAELGQYKETSPEAAETMHRLVDLYHAHGRVFGLIRIAQRFVGAHPADSRHKDVMLKLIDGLQATSRNKDLIAACREFITRYPKADETADIEVRLAETLEETNKRVEAAEAHAAVWQRQGNTETGRRHGVRAISQFASVNNQQVYTRAAELAGQMLDSLPKGRFAVEVGWQGVLQWHRANNWAASNRIASTMLEKNLPLDEARLRQLHLYMAENYERLGQWANATQSYQRARQIEDAPGVHFRMLRAMYRNAAAKPGQMKSLVSDYVRKYPQRDDRYEAQSYLAAMYLRNEQTGQGISLLGQLIQVDARTNDNARRLVDARGKEESAVKKTAQMLRQAIEANDDRADRTYLRYVLAFNVLRDRQEDLPATRKVLRQLISESPGDDHYTRNAINWLLYHPEDEQAFQDDVARILKARRANLHLSSFRNRLGDWIDDAKRHKEHKQHAAYAKAQLAEANQDPVVQDWLQGASSRRKKNAVAARSRLLQPKRWQKLNDRMARSVLNSQAYYYQHYAPDKQRSRLADLYRRLTERFPKDYQAARSYLHAATNYGPPEVAREAALHFLQFEPQTSNPDDFRQLVRAADRNEDADLLGQAYQWILQAEESFGAHVEHADNIGETLAEYDMQEEAVAYWQSHLPLNRDDRTSRDCAAHLREHKEDDQARIAFLKELLQHDSDYHGTYAMWLAEIHWKNDDLDAFEKVLRASRQRQDQRPFRGWGMRSSTARDWVEEYRGDEEVDESAKRRVYEIVRDLRVGRASAVARLALLEMEDPAETSPIQRLLAYQKTTRMVGNSSHDWDRLYPYVQSALSREDYAAAATLLTGMLENIPGANQKRKQTGRKLVAQCYARMGAVGMTIDEQSEIAPLLQAALYLRLGDKDLAFRTYQANEDLFEEHRNEVPVDLILFVCEKYLAAGGEENHQRVESILRGWLVENGESEQFDNKTKAKVQLLLAENFSKAQRFDVARSEYQSVINRYPETPQVLEARFGIGETYMAQKVYNEAEAVFEKLANSRDPQVVIRAEFLRGVLAHRRGDNDRAREIFQNVLERVPSIELANQALFNLAEVYGSEERYINQLNLLRTVGRLGKTSKRWHRPGAPLSIVVQDSDLGISRGDSKIPVVVGTKPGGDSELIHLVSGGAGRGLFRADLETELGEVEQNDGVLQLTGKDVITSDYPDSFKKQFHHVPLSDVEIRVASDAEFEIASSKIVDEQEKSFSEQLEEETQEEQDPRRSQTRPDDQIKPGNLIYLRTEDRDRDVSNDRDEVIVKLEAESGDGVQVALKETGSHTGIFEGTAETAELPAGALASDSAIEHNALKAIDRDPGSYWMSEPDGATPKTLTVDMKDLKLVSQVRLATPQADRHAPVRGTLYGSNDGRFWFRLAGNPPREKVTPVAEQFGPMQARIYSGNYTGYSKWNQVVNLSKNTEPIQEETVETLAWRRPEESENPEAPFAAVWHGKLVQRRAGAARIGVQGMRTAVVLDGHLELPVGPGDRTTDVWLEQGTHNLTIFAATKAGAEGVSAQLARADHNAAEVVMRPFGAADFDLEQPFAEPAFLPDPPQAEIGQTEWNFRFAPKELRYVRFVVDEYLGEAVAINHLEIGGEGAEKPHIPTDADVLALANNDVLEIASGDVVTATYTDEFTQRKSGGSRLLTAELKATYYDAEVSAISYAFEKQPNGAVTTRRKELMRLDPGERFVVEIVDYDRDRTKDRDTVPFEVMVNNGEPVQLTATETDNYSGVFTKEVDTTAGQESGKLSVKKGDRIYARYIDSQNTFPGHAVPRETVVEVNQPTQGQVRILETRVNIPEEDSEAPPQVHYGVPDSSDEVSQFAFEAPLTVEVIDPDAAKDNESTVTVTLTTTDGAQVDVRCVISGAFAEFNQPVGDTSRWALEQGRFVGQVVQQLGGQDSPSLVPVTSGMPRNLVGGPKVRKAKAEDEKTDGEQQEALQQSKDAQQDGSNSSFDRSLVTRVLNLTGKDMVTARYQDQRRPDGEAAELTAEGRLISNGQLACTGQEYEESVERLHVGEKLYLKIEDPDQDVSAKRDPVDVEVSTDFGEKETVQLVETLAHSGQFTGSFTLESKKEPTPGNIQSDMPVIECYFGDTVHVRYVDPAASTEDGQLEIVRDVPVVVGTDGLVVAFSKTFNDESLAVDTKFHIAESYFELFKSHNELERNAEAQADLEAGRRVLREVMEDYPDPKYVPRTAYLLGQFAQELGHWEEAIDSYELIVRRYPEHSLAPDAQYKLAQSFEEAGDFDRALEAYVTLAATYPKSPLIANVMIRISDHFYKQKRYDVAAQVGKKFLERFESHQYASRMAFRVGQCYYKAEKFQQAGDAFDEFVKRFPDDSLCADALFWSGEAFRKDNNNREAFRRYNRCRWDFPASDAAKYARGRLALPEMLQQFEAEVNNLDEEEQ